MNQPVIVLHVVGRMDMGGAESRIMDIYRHMDRSKVQFYFAQHTSDCCFYEKEIEELGGQVFHLPRFNGVNILAYRRAWKELFISHPEIRVVHGHMTSTASLYLPLAKKAGVQLTIAHARSAGVEPGVKGLVTKVLRKNLWKKSDYCFTCSQLAGMAVFGKQAMAAGRVEFIPNAIEVERFVFDGRVREEIRAGLGLTDSFVLGHVGRFSGVKNHRYLLDILAECMVLEKQGKLPKTVLMLLGEGSLMESIRQEAKEKGLSGRVLFLGNKKDVYHYYNAMDFFLLPSFYEGLPGTAIEAQANGVRGILSDRVTGEAVITDLLEQLSIQEPAVCWAKRIESRNKEGKENPISLAERKEYAKQVKEAGYDVLSQGVRLQEFYLTGALN